MTDDGRCGNRALLSPSLMSQIQDKDREREDDKDVGQTNGKVQVASNGVIEQGGVGGGDMMREGAICRGQHINMVET